MRSRCEEDCGIGVYEAVHHFVDLYHVVSFPLVLQRLHTEVFESVLLLIRPESKPFINRAPGDFYPTVPDFGAR